MRLGLCIGTKYMGYAVADTAELLDWGVKAAGGKWNSKKLQKMVTTLQAIVYTYHVKEVIIKIPDVLPASKGFMQLVGAMNVLFEGMGVQARYIRLSDLKLHYCNRVDVNKECLFAAIATKHPELALVYPKQLITDTLYYNKIAEAVGAVFYEIHP